MILDSAARLAPTSVADSVAFEVGSQAYTWDDVVLAATLWGEWQQLRDRVRASLGSARTLRRDEAAPSAEEIEQAADEFRYARDLLTAEETETWLSQRGLDFDDLLQYVERALARRQSALRLDRATHDLPSDDEVQDAVWGEAVCSGWLLRLADKLAARAALHERRRQEMVTGKGVDRVWPERQDKIATAPPRACPRDAETGCALGRHVSPLQRCQWVRHLDECFDQDCSGLLTPRAMRDEIRLHQVDWVRVRVRYALFETEDAAREVVLCVRQDLEALDEAATRAGVRVCEDSFRLEQMDEETRYAFLGARQNDLLAPLRWAGKHGVFLVVEKLRPAIDDPDTRDRAGESVLARLLQEEVERRVRWYERF